MEGVGPLGEESTLHMPVVTPDEAESLSESLDADWTRASRDPLTFSSDDDDAPNLSASFFLPDVTDVEVHDAGVKVTARTFDSVQMSNHHHFRPCRCLEGATKGTNTRTREYMYKFSMKCTLTYTACSTCTRIYHLHDVQCT